MVFAQVLCCQSNPWCHLCYYICTCSNTTPVLVVLQVVTGLSYAIYHLRFYGSNILLSFQGPEDLFNLVLKGLVLWTGKRLGLNRTMRTRKLHEPWAGWQLPLFRVTKLLIMDMPRGSSLSILSAAPSSSSSLGYRTLLIRSPGCLVLVHSFTIVGAP
jgi:hypothetical protein